MSQAAPSTVSLTSLLRALIENGGSDLHIQTDEVPVGRIHGDLGRFELPPLSEGEVLTLAREILGSPEKLEQFTSHKDVDAAFALEGLGRFRANLFYQRGKPGLVLRVIGTKILSLDDLDLPPVLKTIASANDGLVLVTGATGSGKSTTLAAMIDHLNATEARHIMTLEDPIEFVHTNKQALINQREIGMDTETFASGLKHVLRQDPDVILIGEMRDSESASVALTAAETGHLVFGTLHTQDAAESLERMLNLFPTDRTHQIRMQLSLGLRAIVCQRLLGRAGGGRIAAVEVLVNTPRIRKLILEGDTTKIPSAIQAGRTEGMQTFNQALTDLVKAGKVTEEEAIATSPKPDEFRMNLKGVFSGTTGM
ncbi:MAG TPA: type IV pilus twitching motility protein PilT [Verrucomicrobiota bacterium]|nr:type IV pili twitching motility protein PilT [Verrucomicrobiales bacterium]HRI13952.1 type IV pilus twitching motility protein PilT [Verrucomicrobiota bacterium]